MRALSLRVLRRCWNWPILITGLIVSFLIVIFAVPGAPALDMPDKGTKQMGALSGKQTPFCGILSEAFDFQKGTLKAGQSMSSILDKWRVPAPLIHQAAIRAKDLFDVRKMQVGHPYWVIRKRAPEKGVRYFVYEQSAIDCVVFDLTAPVSVYKAEKQVKTRTRQVNSRITTSLWEALSKKGLNCELTLKICDIFAWSIDFHHMARGDEFRVIFDEEIHRGEMVRVGPVKAAKVIHRGNAFYAFYFREGETEHYYDDQGRSLQRAFLKAPVKYGRVSSGFSRRRLHPVLNKYRPHPGIDYAAPKGTPIMSVGDGVILRTAYNKANGNYIQIRHGGGYVTQYLHMCQFHPSIRPGVKVRQGQIIGYVGSTGLATGPHVDFRCWKNGELIDLSKVDLPAGKPVKKEYAALFYSRVKELKEKLDSGG